MRRRSFYRSAVLAAMLMVLLSLGAASGLAYKLDPESGTNASGRSSECAFAPQLVRNEPGLCTSAQPFGGRPAETTSEAAGSSAATLGWIFVGAASFAVTALGIARVARRRRPALAR